MTTPSNYQELQTQLSHAEDLVKRGDLSGAEVAYVTILNQDCDTDESSIKVQETAMDQLSTLYQEHNKSEQMKQLILNSRNFLTTVTKAKTSKIVRKLIEKFNAIPDCTPLQIEVCQSMIEWCIEGKRTFLKQNLETKLVALYHQNSNYSEALKLIATLLKELKRLDDKMVLIEVQLLESKVCHSLRNFPKARAALTSARTSANAIYCPPMLQASLDMQSGILHAEEKDYKTAFSYFFETYECYNTANDSRSIEALKYMLLCKIMVGLTDDIHSITSGKIGLQHLGREIDAMKAVSNAHKNRSLQEFEQALTEYKEELGNDAIIRTHLAALYDTLLEQNLVRVIEPYSRVEIAKVAQLVRLPTAQVETKLSQMILDQTLFGILDQGAGCLILYDEKERDESYEMTLNTLKNMGNVVESLYQKAAQLN